MATLAAQIVPIEIKTGVQPTTDRTPLSTPHYTMTDKVRFWRGVAQKIGGWLAFMFAYSATISGIARTLYSNVIDELATTIIGTESYLYSLYGSTLTNISPLESTTHTIADSISTDYATLGSNPISTTNGSGTVVVTDSNAAKYRTGDFYTLSGATTTNGITDTLLNARQQLSAVTASTVSFNTTGTANATGSGGGASVDRATGLLTFDATAHGMEEGWRTKITGAATTGGVADTDINNEFVIRNVLTDSFQVMTDGTATSSVSAGGGASTAYQKQIAAGGSDATFGVGYGVGLYGTGLYGTARTSSTGITYPRIWFADRFGDRIIATPGNQSKVYIWDGSTSTAPTVLTNAPTDVNYLFVSDSILVTFGHDNVPNKIFASDQGDATEWTASSTNQVYEDIVEGAGRLISSVPVLGSNLIFTPNQTYQFSYIGLPLVWSVKLLDNSVGIIGPMARCSVNNVAYWMANNNFYMWSGGNVQQIPSNSGNQCTCLNYVFSNINTAQSYKCFAWYNDIFNEVWFHYPSANSEECDSIARVSLDDFSWSVDTMDRTCAEYPDNLFLLPRLISSDGTLYNHESGNNDNTDPLTFTLTGNLRSGGKESLVFSGLIPDSLTDGDTTIRVQTYNWPQQSTTVYDRTYTVADDGGRINDQLGGRYWKYTWSGSELDQPWIMGAWSELLQKGPPN